MNIATPKPCFFIIPKVCLVTSPLQWMFVRLTSNTMRFYELTLSSWHYHICVCKCHNESNIFCIQKGDKTASLTLSGIVHVVTQLHLINLSGSLIVSGCSWKKREGSAVVRWLGGGHWLHCMADQSDIYFPLKPWR